MWIVNDLISFYINHILIPKIMDYSNPGFLYTKITDKGVRVSIRDILLLEEFLTELEKEIIKQPQGADKLYQVGKIGGYTFAALSELPNINNTQDLKELEKQTKFLSLFIACTYGTVVEHEINIAEKTFTQTYDDFVVCPKNGIGKLVIEGSAAGIWAWIMQDKTMEGRQTHCIGRGDKKCVIITGPPDKIQATTTFTNFKEIELNPEYEKLNSPQPAPHAKSLDELIKHQIFQIKNNKITYEGHRYLDVDIAYPYTLEQLLDEQTLYQVARKTYAKIGEKIPEEFIPQYLGAQGWGDITLVDEQIEIKHYPYLQISTTYPLIRGILAGLTGKDYHNAQNTIHAGSNTVVITT